VISSVLENSRGYTVALGLTRVDAAIREFVESRSHKATSVE